MQKQKQKSYEETSFDIIMQHRVPTTVTSRLHDEMDGGGCSGVCSIFIIQKSCNTVLQQSNAFYRGNPESRFLTLSKRFETYLLLAVFYFCIISQSILYSYYCFYM